MGKQYIHVWKRRGGGWRVIGGQSNEDSDIKSVIEDYWVGTNTVAIDFRYNHTLVLDSSNNTFEKIDITKMEGFDDV